MSTTPIWPIEGIALDSTGHMVEGSLAYMVNRMAEARFTETLVSPNLTDGVTVVSANTDWGLGAYATVVAASAIATDFQVTAVAIETCDKNAVFQLELYQGAGDTLIATMRFSIIGGFFGNVVYRFGSVLVPANARIRARLASSDGLANQATITMSIRYHPHT